MAGSVTRSSSVRIGDALEYRFAVVVSGAGACSGNTVEVMPGAIMQVKYVPHATTPFADGFTLTLVDEDGVDLLDGVAASLTGATPQMYLLNKPTGVYNRQRLDIRVSAGGADKLGTVSLTVRDDL